ncbi:uncharacterized protein LOC112904074 [Agrilus planipennis]|uniref:Uncharacterized protein LOC112904074 n=1 Tax=Agrilus planipennis TaxID=224129 RepID=A0A7F5QVH9_AGRPL|nr:uncharacterized protein LOC112904074 [Agrilus planipennis]
MAKKIYNSWKQDDMDEALQKHRDGKIGFNEACRLYSIPKPTFRRHLRGLNKTNKFGRPNDMTREMENELAQHILNMESAFFGLTVTNVRKLAYQFAEKYQLPHRFNKEKEIAGKKWFARFMKEHPILSLRVPEPTSMARSKGFNKERVNEFFDKYEGILEQHKFTADKVYNVDETALSTVHKPSKVIAQKGKHQVGALTSGERGLTTTCVCAMNAAGEYIPPMLIYKRVRMLETLKRGAPPNTLFGCSKNGLITSELFVQWLQHCIKCTKLEKSDQKQMLLMLDGHSTHTKNLEAIELAREYGIVMLSFPAHTTHRLQPLDRSFFKSLKSNYNQAASSWLRSNPGAVIKQGNVAELLGKAYPRSVRMDIAQNGFRATGLWPSDRNIFTEEDFVSSMQIGPSDQGSTAVTDPEPLAKSVAAPATPNASASPPMSGMSTPPATGTRPEIGISPPIGGPTSPASEMTPRTGTPPTMGMTPTIGTPPMTRKPPGARTPTTAAKLHTTESPQPSSSRVDDPTNKKQIMACLNIISPIPSLTKVDQKMRKGTSKTTELTSSPY